VLRSTDLWNYSRRDAMNTASRQDVTGWLRAWSQGDEAALEKLTPLVYGELHQRARRAANEPATVFSRPP